MVPSALVITRRLRYVPPYDWEAMLRHLAARAVGGVERVHDGGYERVIRHGAKTGRVRVTHRPSASSVVAAIDFTDERALPDIVVRLRRMFDVDADLATVGAHLSRDPMLAPLVAARPGLRVPGAYDGFELAIRAVLGQQVSLERGRRLACELVRITRRTAFPTAKELARADLDALGMPRARKDTLRAIAEAALDDPGLFERKGSIDGLRAIRGVGDWTAQYIALRAWREPDAFPASDVALLRRAGRNVTELLALAERWRPWRGYAAQHLWTSLTDMAR